MPGITRAAVPPGMELCEAAGDALARMLRVWLLQLDVLRIIPGSAKSPLCGAPHNGDFEHGFVQTMCRKCGDELRVRDPAHPWWR